MKRINKILSLIIVCLIVVLLPQKNYALSIENNESKAELLTVNNQQNISSEERRLRNIVVDYMYQMGSIRWTTSSNIDTKCVALCADKNCQTALEVGKIYRGLPYKHSSSTLDRMQYCLDENNSLKEWVVELDELGGFQTYFGSACYSSIQLAWARVSNTVNATCAMEALLRPDLVGTIPVGNWSDLWTNKINDQNTSKCFDLLGSDAIYEDYALVKAGDAFIRLGDDGAHAVMAATDAVVVRNANGKINPKSSYFYTHEQGGPNSDSSVISSWSLNRKRTFASLASQFFLPITIKELAEGKMDEVSVDIVDDLDGIYGLTTGIIVSNYYIDAVIVDIKENGNDFFNKKVYCRVDNIKDYNDTVAMFDRSFVKEYDLALLTRSIIDLNFNENNTYHVTFTVLLQNGVSEVVKEYDF